MKSQGIASESDLRDRLAARIQQEKYVELKTGPLAVVTGDEARAWFEQNRDKLALPERVRARHVFLATLERPEQEAKALLETALADLTAGTADFATLASRLSEDPASKTRGGDLGWMSRARLPADFADSGVFPAAAHPHPAAHAHRLASGGGHRPQTGRITRLRAGARRSDRRAGSRQTPRGRPGIPQRPAPLRGGENRRLSRHACRVNGARTSVRTESALLPRRTEVRAPFDPQRLRRTRRACRESRAMRRRVRGPQPSCQHAECLSPDAWRKPNLSNVSVYHSI